MQIPQINALRLAMRSGLVPMFRKPPVTAVEWADEHFYLSSESSYQEGRWETLPFQRAILNSMGNDEIRTVNVIKSARVGYSKMLNAASAYQIEHKRRNILILLPTDSAAAGFMKSQIETMIRDVPSIRELAPWSGKKDRDSTLDTKRFSHGKQMWVRGGAAAKNYRELSADTVIYDELAAFEPDVEKEGSPTFLGDKRIEGSTSPKSIRGSTPKIRGTCQIEAAASESRHFFRLHVPCPCCGELQSLKWGGKDAGYGIKWNPENPLETWYICEHTGCKFLQHEVQAIQDRGKWICDHTGVWTTDGYEFFDADGVATQTPETVTWHVWTAYSPLTTWGRVVSDFLKAKSDPNKLKTFTNTTLGEAWEEDQGERLEWESLFARRENYSQQLPEGVLYLTGGIDTQDDRYEGRVYGWGKGEEAWLIDKWVLTGDPASEVLRKKVRDKLRQQYSGMPVGRWGWDSGGHYTDEVYAESKALGISWVIPLKGHSQYGRPIASFPTKRDRKSGVYLTMVGTDNAKELIYNRLRMEYRPDAQQPGFIHFPADDMICDEDELKQITAETKRATISQGRRVYRWRAGGKRNEGLDCLVYALAALRISQTRFGLNLELIEKPGTQPGPIAQPTNQPAKAGNWLDLGENKWL